MSTCLRLVVAVETTAGVQCEGVGGVPVLANGIFSNSGVLFFEPTTAQSFLSES